MVRAGCVFVAGIHPSRTWTSGSFESVRWNACVHRLDLGLYSHPKEFWGNGVWTHVNSKGKIPSTGKCPQRSIEPATLWQRAQALFVPFEMSQVVTERERGGKEREKKRGRKGGRERKGRGRKREILCAWVLVVANGWEQCARNPVLIRFHSINLYYLQGEMCLWCQKWLPRKT